MRPDRLIVMTVFIGLMVTVVMLLRDKSDFTDLSGQVAFPDLKARLAQVDDITVTAGEKSVQLSRSGDQWVVVEKFHYQADSAEIAKTLRSLADMKILEQKTANPAYFAQLGLDLNDAVSPPVQVSVTAAGDVFKLHLGKRASGQKGQYALLGETGPALLVNTTLNLSADANSWLKTELLDVDARSVREIFITGLSGEVTEIDNPVQNDDGPDNAFIKNLPKGKQLKSETVANEITRSLSGLRFTDVQPIDGLDFTMGMSAQFELDSNATLLLRGLTLDGINWVAVSLGSAFSDGQRREFGIRDGIDEWAYQVNNYRYDQLFKSMDDLVEPLENASSSEHTTKDSGPSAVTEQE